MRLWALAVLGIGALSQPALSAPAPKVLDLDTVNNADRSGKSLQGIDPALIKAQVLLDRARFSPGVIDGRNGDNLQDAVKAFERARDLKVDGVIDEEVWAKLNEGSSDPAVIEYKIGDGDVKGPFVKEIPEKLEDQASLERLGYTSPLELLAEKFHMDSDLLKALNPGKSFEKAGTSIVVANVGSERKPDKTQKVTRVEVVKSQRVLRALTEDGQLVAVYPASIGSKEKPAPEGTYTVRAVAENPTYTYNPDYDFKGVKAEKKFVIKPGPNNPVGSVWIDLSVDSFGIHGTPEPDKVGKTYSNGCARLTNWDAEELARLVHKGTTVTFID
jgi:lipoprotein-anchoring transpeptidase ErfK/SrfK